MSKVVIIGAGFGGLGCAKNLVGAGGLESVTVVDAKDWFTIGGTWQYVWSGRIDKEAAKWPLQDAAAAFEGVDFKLNTTVASLDLAGKSVTLADGSTLPYDHLVLSPGVVGDASGIPGINEALDMYSFDDVGRQEAELGTIIEKARAGEKQTLLVAIGATPYKCPVAPFEAAFIADDKLRRLGVRHNVRVAVSSPVEWPLPDAARSVFEKMLLDKNVDFLPNMPLTKVDAGGTTAHFADGSALEASRVWAIYPQMAPQFIKDAGITNPRGFVPVDIRTNRVKGHEDNGVFCIGDCCGIMVDGKPHPKAGEFAWQMGEMVANVIKETEGYVHSRLGACIAECGGGGGVLVAPDLTAVVADPDAGKAKCAVVEMGLRTGEEGKKDWVNKYVSLIFGEGGRRFSPAAAAVATSA